MSNPNKRRKWSGYILLRLTEETKAELDAAAWTLGVERTELVRMIVNNYIALIKIMRMHPAMALLYPYPLPPVKTEAPVELPTGANAEKGEPTRGNEPQLVAKR